MPILLRNRNFFQPPAQTAGLVGLFALLARHLCAKNASPPIPMSIHCGEGRRRVVSGQRERGGRGYFFKERHGRPSPGVKESGHLAHIFNPGRAMRLCSADSSPQALMRARCPRSLVKNRRRETAAPYNSKKWAGCPRSLRKPLLFL